MRKQPKQGPAVTERELAKKAKQNRSLIGRKRRAGKTDADILEESQRAGSAGKSETYAAAQARKEVALANRHELRVAREQGKVVAIEDAQKVMSAMIMAARAKFLAIGLAVAPELALSTDADECRAIVDAAVKEGLVEMSMRDYAEVFEDRMNEETDNV